MNDAGREAKSTGLTLKDVANRVKGRLEGDPSIRVRNVAPLQEAGTADLGFLAHRAYVSHLESSSAAALLVSSDLEGRAAKLGVPRVVVEDAHRALLPLLRHFHPDPEPSPGVHPTAVLARGVDLEEDVTVGPYAVIQEGVRIRSGSRIGAHAFVGRSCRIGRRCRLHPQVVLYPGSVLGDEVILHAGVRVGVDGFGYVLVEGEHRKIPQVGSCVIEDGVEVGANTCLDRGSIGTTSVGAGTKLDNLVHLGHNVRVGAGSLLVAQVGVAGSTRLGRGVMCGGQAGLTGHIEVGDGARIGGQAGVIGDIEAGETVSGYPARSHREYLKGMALVLKLPELLRRVRSLERALEEDDPGGGDDD